MDNSNQEKNFAAVIIQQSQTKLCGHFQIYCPEWNLLTFVSNLFNGLTYLMNLAYSQDRGQKHFSHSK